jgi:hypothetical protein
VSTGSGSIYWSIENKAAKLPALASAGAVLASCFFSDSKVLAQRAEAQRGGDAASRTAVQRSGVIKLNNLEDVLKRFNKNDHVYYVNNPDTGTIPVSDRQREELAARLSGTDHYLVMVGKCQGFSYKAPTGERHFDKDAVWTMLGQKLFDVPAFASITNRTGLPSANLFVLTLDEAGKPYRDFHFNASKAYETFNCKDEDIWDQGGRGIGHLGIPDFRAQRYASGVSSTLDALDERFRSEFGRVEGARLKLEQDAQTSVQSVNSLRAEYLQLLQLRNKEFPGRSGNLFAPTDLPQLDQSARSAESYLRNREYQKAIDSIGAQTGLYQQRIAALKDYPNAVQLLAQIEQQVAQALQNPLHFLVSQPTQSLKESLEVARATWSKGDSSYTKHLHLAQSQGATLGQALSTAEEQHALDGQTIQTYGTKIAQHEKSKFSGEFSKELGTAKDFLVRSQQLWKSTNSAYPRVMEELAKSSKALDARVDALKSAEASARVTAGVVGLVGLAGAALALVGTRKVYSAARAEEANAKKALAKLKGALAAKELGLSELEALKGQALLKDGRPIAYPHGSKTYKLANDARAAIQKMWVFQIIAQQEIVQEAEAAIAKGGTLSASNYRHALAVMKDKPVAFSAKNRDKVKSAFGEAAKGVDVLAVPLDELQDFSRSLKDIDKEFISLSTTAKESLDEIVAARTKVENELSSLKKGLAAAVAAESALSGLAAKGPYPSLFSTDYIKTTLLPDMTDRLAALKEKVVSDPVGAYEEAQVLGKGIQVVSKTFGALTEFRKGACVAIANSKDGLERDSIGAQWIDQQLGALSTEFKQHAENMVAGLKKGASDREGFSLGRGIAALQGRIDEVLQAKKDLFAVCASITKAKDEVAAERARMGTALGIPSDKILKEKGFNPDSLFEEIDRGAESARKALSAADLTSVSSLNDTIKATLGKVNSIVQGTKKAFDAHAEVSTTLEKQIASTESDIASATQVLDQIKQKYSPSVLLFDSSDMRGPEADGTLDNNPQEANESLAVARERLLASREAYKNGAIRASVEEGKRVATCIGMCSHRNQEIYHKDKRLAAAEKQNGELIEKLTERCVFLREKCNDYRLRESSVKFIVADLTRQSNEVSRLQSERVRDPIAIGKQVESLKISVEKAEKAVAADVEDYNEAKAALKASSKALQNAFRKSQEIEGNAIPDSASTDKAQAALPPIERELADLQQKYEKARFAEWSDFIAAADKLTKRINDNVSIMEKEDAAGAEALKKMDSVKSKVSSAAGWRGSYGISISGDPGARELRRARELFRLGSYAEALALAESAQSLAADAIAQAEQEVLDERRRLEREREEAERRERRRREEEREEEERRRSSSNSWSSSSSSSSWGSSSGGSDTGGFSGSDSGGSGTGGW